MHHSTKMQLNATKKDEDQQPCKKDESSHLRITPPRFGLTPAAAAAAKAAAAAAAAAAEFIIIINYILLLYIIIYYYLLLFIIIINLVVFLSYIIKRV